LADVVVDLFDESSAIQRLMGRTHRFDDEGRPKSLPPISVISANLDHIAQFGKGGRWHGTVGNSLRPTSQPPSVDAASSGMQGTMEWLTLLDGAPLVAQANRLTGRNWPRLAGSDLIGPLLDAAEETGASVGFLGGSYLIQRLLSRRLTITRPKLVIAGMWSPERATLANHNDSLELARTIREAGPHLLVVGLGKPRQELWMARYGVETGANVLLAFGAVVDFLAGAMMRAPAWASGNGLEWAWRLALEPRRLARRYLLDDPPSLLQLRRHSSVIETRVSDLVPRQPAAPLLTGNPDGKFVPDGEPADVVVYVVTYNSEPAIDTLMASLRREARSLRLRVIVADNDSTDGTLHSLSKYPDAYALSTGGNLGYATGINAAHRVSGQASSILVLNPDLEVLPGSIQAMYRRLVTSDAGLVVPQLLESDGSTSMSLRREPTVATAFGDAFLGSKFPTRPGWLAETDYALESYQNAHRIEWATGAAIMVRADLAERIGDWDEQFFLYSEEVDYFRRARESGETAWYEPLAQMVHHGGGSGTSTELNALLAVNRVRYVRKYHDARYATWFRNGVALTELLRFYKPTRLSIFRTIMDEASWESLPGPTATEHMVRVLEAFPVGTVIIPAHNEAAVIGRTLACLAPVLGTGRVEVIVACNGCDDDTAAIARTFTGVVVLEVETASKVAALNAADKTASHWPRLYLDADISMSPTTLRMVFSRLGKGDILAARPSFRYDDCSASWPVRAFYRARRRISSTHEALWGAGAYALTEQGHVRFAEFPAVTADDLFVDLQFGWKEKAVLHTPPVTVVTPRNVKGLMAVLRRNYRGKAELRHLAAPEPSGAAPSQTAHHTLKALFSSVRSPASAIDALCYAGFAVAARLRHGRVGTAGPTAWERDDSSRDGTGKR
jgi:exopolysaccharide biosynthesis WecB/TagA/CpsF family protein